MRRTRESAIESSKITPASRTRGDQTGWKSKVGLQSVHLIDVTAKSTGSVDAIRQEFICGGNSTNELQF
jgi:hypothetical protein